MNHIIAKAESYARHFHMEQQGHRNQADQHYTSLCEALVATAEAVSRSSVVAYREGRQGMPTHPDYQPWELEAWRSGVADSPSR